MTQPPDDYDDDDDDVHYTCRKPLTDLTIMNFM